MGTLFPVCYSAITMKNSNLIKNNGLFAHHEEHEGHEEHEEKQNYILKTKT